MDTESLPAVAVVDIKWDTTNAVLARSLPHNILVLNAPSTSFLLEKAIEKALGCKMKSYVGHPPSYLAIMQRVAKVPYLTTLVVLCLDTKSSLGFLAEENKKGESSMIGHIVTPPVPVSVRTPEYQIAGRILCKTEEELVELLGVERLQQVEKWMEEKMEENSPSNKPGMHPETPPGNLLALAGLGLLL